MAEFTGKLAFKGAGGVVTPSGTWDKFGAEMTSFWTSEVVSCVTMPVAMYIMEHLPASVMKYASSALGKCIEPVIEPLENLLSKVCKLKSCQPDLTKTRSERAENLAHVLCLTTPPVLLTWLIKFNIRRSLDTHWKVPGAHGASWNILPKSGKELMTLLTDEGAHVGFMGLLGGPYAKEADEAVDTIKSIIKKAGFSERIANDMALMLVLHEGPNIAAGVTASAGLALNRLFFGSGAAHYAAGAVEKLMASRESAQQLVQSKV